MLQRPHVVQPVSQLDQHYTHIADHGQQHLANILRLAVLAIGKLNLVDLRHALDNVRNLLAKLRGNVFGCDRRVFNGVMQQPRGNGRRVQLHLRQHHRHFKRMQNVGFARSAKLALVMFQAELPPLADDLQIVARPVGAHHRKEFMEFIREQLLLRPGFRLGFDP